MPYRLEHLSSLLVRDDTKKIPQRPIGKLEPGPYAGQLTGLISRLEARMADPRYGFIFAPPDQTLDYGWLTEAAASLLDSGPERPGIKVVDFSEVPSEILPLVAGVLARLIYNVQLWIDPAVRTPICVVCDEAHLYLPVHAESGPVQRAALETFEAIAKEGRKYGIALLVVSQRPADISRTILSQCNNFIVMRSTSDEDQAVVERLVPETLGTVTSILPLLDGGGGNGVGRCTPAPDPAEIRRTGTPAGKRDPAVLDEVGRSGLEHERHSRRGRGPPEPAPCEPALDWRGRRAGLLTTLCLRRRGLETVVESSSFVRRLLIEGLVFEQGRGERLQACPVAAQPQQGRLIALGDDAAHLEVDELAGRLRSTFVPAIEEA